MSKSQRPGQNEDTSANTCLKSRPSQATSREKNLSKTVLSAPKERSPKTVEPSLVVEDQKSLHWSWGDDIGSLTWDAPQSRKVVQAGATVIAESHPGGAYNGIYVSSWRQKVCSEAIRAPAKRKFKAIEIVQFLSGCNPCQTCYELTS